MNQQELKNLELAEKKEKKSYTREPMRGMEYHVEQNGQFIAIKRPKVEKLPKMTSNDVLPQVSMTVSRMQSPDFVELQQQVLKNRMLNGIAKVLKHEVVKREIEIIENSDDEDRESK